jgi:hypothetical protein
MLWVKRLLALVIEQKRSTDRTVFEFMVRSALNSQINTSLMKNMNKGFKPLLQVPVSFHIS